MPIKHQDLVYVNHEPDVTCVTEDVTRGLTLV